MRLLHTDIYYIPFLLEPISVLLLYTLHQSQRSLPSRCFLSRENPEWSLIGRHFQRGPLRGNESVIVIGLHQKRNVCRFGASAGWRVTLRDFGPCGCQGDNYMYLVFFFLQNATYMPFFAIDKSSHAFNQPYMWSWTLLLLTFDQQYWTEPKTVEGWRSLDNDYKRGRATTTKTTTTRVITTTAEMKATTNAQTTEQKQKPWQRHE